MSTRNWQRPISDTMSLVLGPLDDSLRCQIAAADNTGAPFATIKVQYVSGASVVASFSAPVGSGPVELVIPASCMLNVSTPGVGQTGFCIVAGYPPPAKELR